MNKMEYMPVDCLQVPKVLFQMEKYKNLSNTAKILYSLFLDRLKFAVQNGWVDGKGDLYVIYPKSEMKKDLNTTRYGVDQAVQELVEIGNLVRIIPNNGKANHFYINDIYENEMEEESMMTLDSIMQICRWKKEKSLWTRWWQHPEIFWKQLQIWDIWMNMRHH